MINTLKAYMSVRNQKFYIMLFFFIFFLAFKKNLQKKQHCNSALLLGSQVIKKI